MHKNVAERFGRHSKVKTTTSPSHVKISPSLSSELRMPCEPSATTLGERHARALSVGRQMPRTRTSVPRPLGSKIPLLLRRIHRAGDPRTPGRRRRSFREFNEFRPANFFSSPWTFSPPLHAVAAGCPNFIPRLKSPRLTSWGRKLGRGERGRGTDRRDAITVSLISPLPLPSLRDHDLGGGPRMSNFRDDARLGSIAAL